MTMGQKEIFFFLGMKFLLNYSPNKKQFLFHQLGASQLQILDMKQQAKTPVNQITGFIYYKNIEDSGTTKIYYNSNIFQDRKHRFLDLNITSEHKAVHYNMGMSKFTSRNIVDYFHTQTNGHQNIRLDHFCIYALPNTSAWNKYTPSISILYRYPI